MCVCASLPRTCHIAPSLRLFVPNCLTGIDMSCFLRCPLAILCCSHGCYSSVPIRYLWGAKFSKAAGDPTCPPLPSCCAGDKVFFLFGGGQIFHMALLLTSHSLTADLTIRLSISNRTIFLVVLSDTLCVLCCVFSFAPLRSGHLCGSSRVLPLGVLLAALTFPGPLWTHPLYTAGMA
jgi:hypothetical protein